MSNGEQEIAVGRLDELDDPGCREFAIGDGDWPFRGFVVRKGDDIYAVGFTSPVAMDGLKWICRDVLDPERDIA